MPLRQLSFFLTTIGVLIEAWLPHCLTPLFINAVQLRMTWRQWTCECG